jgi:4-oxalmesaconate hydratase
MSLEKPLTIDCHGHYTTAPKALETWRNQQIAGIKDPVMAPKVADLKISDDELRETIEHNQLRLMQGRGRAPALWPTILATSMSPTPGRQFATSCATA